jgi:hypothetical protein
VTDPAPTESLHDFAYHVVKGGKERTITVKSGSPWPKSARFRNTLSAASLARIRVLVAASRELSVAMTTAEMTKLAGAESDVKGVLGALRILDVGGVIHATAGQRRQLIWNPGRRPAGSAPPRGADHARFMHLRDLLRQPTTPWLSTDYLIRHARFDPDLDTRDHYLDTGEEIRGERKRHERGLPVNFYRDSGKSARKYVLGALKALYWLERVAWSNYSPQAIQWRWVGPESTSSLCVGRRRLRLPSSQTRIRISTARPNLTGARGCVNASLNGGSPSRNRVSAGSMPIIQKPRASITTSRSCAGETPKVRSRNVSVDEPLGDTNLEGPQGETQPRLTWR